MTDRQTDGRTDRRPTHPGKNNMSPNPNGERHNELNNNDSECFVSDNYKGRSERILSRTTEIIIITDL